MRRSPPLAGALLSSMFLFAAAAAAAQPAQPPAPGRPAAGARPPPAAKPGAAQPAAAQPADTAPPAAPPVPPKIEVNDPLLAPVPAAPHQLGSWRDALGVLSTRSVDLAIARQEMERAEGLRRQALAASLTTVNASGTIFQSIVPSASPVLSAQITASQPILAPRAWYAIGTAELSIKSAKLSVEDKRRLALAQVADAIVGVYTAERVAEVNRVGLQSSLQRLDLAERKTRLGDGTRLDVLRAQQDASLARATLIGGDEGLLKAREALGLTLGSSEGFSVPTTISLNDMEQSLRSTCAPGAVDQRADILQARNDLEVSQRQITDAKLAFSPTAVISTTASVANEPTIGTQKSYAWSIQGVLSIPIWEGGGRYGALRIAKANVEESKVRLEAAQRGATLESSQAFRAVGVAEQARKVAEQNRDLAREAARLSTRAFEAGAGTSFDLVDSGQKERAAEIDLIVKEFELIKARLSALLAASNCTY